MSLALGVTGELLFVLVYVCVYQWVGGVFLGNCCIKHHAHRRSFLWPKAPPIYIDCVGGEVFNGDIDNVSAYYQNYMDGVLSYPLTSLLC
jgi:hypothetical protein